MLFRSKEAEKEEEKDEEEQDKEKEEQEQKERERLEREKEEQEKKDREKNDREKNDREKKDREKKKREKKKRKKRQKRGRRRKLRSWAGRVERLNMIFSRFKLIGSAPFVLLRQSFGGFSRGVARGIGLKLLWTSDLLLRSCLASADLVERTCSDH